MKFLFRLFRKKQPVKIIDMSPEAILEMTKDWKTINLNEDKSK